MQNRFPLLLCALALVLAGCEKQDDREHDPIKYDDAEYLLGGLVKEVDGEYVPMHGFLLNDCLVIPVSSAFEAEDHFRSLATPITSLKEQGNTIVWNLTDGQGASQGDAVFSLGDSQDLARISLPDSFPEGLRTVVYRNSEGLLKAVSPEVREDLEDNYYYGAIVDISDHGCGSGKFVVLREYNFSNGANGLAIRLDNTRWHLKKLPDDGKLEGQIWGRSSCLSTMNTARDILLKDWSVLTKQLKAAGSRQPDQHFASSNRAWNGWHYYLCFHDGECDTIGPFNDLEFYECWLYWFYPDGNRIVFW